ncbi:MAG: hypothetical protein ACOYI3_03940 [Christensenellales bacterium]|jgi:hypothetical protein
MNEFFTWSSLGTYAGAVLLTTLITQLIKGIGFIAKIPTRIVSYVIALAVLLSANAAAGTLDWATAGLCAVNAVVVALASNGTHDAAAAALKKDDDT